MVYQYYQQLPSALIKGVYQIKTYDIAIVQIWWFASGLWYGIGNKPRHKQLISNLYKYKFEKKLTRIMLIAINSTHYVW